MSSDMESSPDPGRGAVHEEVVPLNAEGSFQIPQNNRFTMPLFSTGDPDSPFAQMSPTPTPRAPEAPILEDPMNTAPSEPPPVPTGVRRMETIQPADGKVTSDSQNGEEAVTGETAIKAVASPNAVNAPSPGMQPVSFSARKKGGTVKNWKSRFWLFEPTGGVLSYFEDKDHKNRKGYIDLSSCIGMGPIRHDRETHALGLRTKDRLWVLAFDSTDEMGRIQTLLGSVVQGSLEVKDVPISALGKLKRGFSSKKSKPSNSSGARNSSPDKKGGEKASSSHSPLGTSSSTSSSSLNSIGSGKVMVSHMEEHGNRFNSNSSEAANTNEKAGLAKLNQNLNRIKEYTGREFTLECDMSVVRARLETDHPEWKDRPGDVIYDGFMGALSNKLQELCESAMYRDIINHKINGRIAIRVSDDEKDLISKTPYCKIDQGVLIIVCHRSLLTANLVDLGEDLLDELSIGEPLHICTIKDIEDHKQGIKSCLIKIQAQLGVTCQFECDYTEGFRTLQSINPTSAKVYKKSWGEVIYRYLEMATTHILKTAADATLKANFVASIPNRAIRVTTLPSDDLFRSAWSTTDGGAFNILINASKFMPELPLAF